MVGFRWRWFRRRIGLAISSAPILEEGWERIPSAFQQRSDNFAPKFEPDPDVNCNPQRNDPIHYIENQRIDRGIAELEQSPQPRFQVGVVPNAIVDPYGCKLLRELVDRLNGQARPIRPPKCMAVVDRVPENVRLGVRISAQHDMVLASVHVE